MQINQQELDEAIETISEGGQALGVSCEDVYKCMATDIEMVMTVFEYYHANANNRVFSNVFECDARSLLAEALRAKQEVDNGLL